MIEPSVLQARQLYEQIEIDLASFCRSIENDVLGGEVYDLPLLPEGRRVDQMDMESQQGLAAGEMALRCIRDFERMPGQVGTTTKKWPGVVFVSKPVAAQLAEINEKKATLQALLIELFPRHERTDQYRRLFPGQVVLQITRKIHAIDMTPDVVMFSWAGNTVATRKVTPAKAHKMMDRYANQVPGEWSVEDWQCHVEELRGNMMAHLAHGYELRVRTVGAPHPRVELIYPIQGPTLSEYVWNASLPLFVHVPADRELPPISPLNNLGEDKLGRPNKNGRRRRTPVDSREARRDRGTAVRISQGLNLYAYVPPAKKTQQRTERNDRVAEAKELGKVT